MVSEAPGSVRTQTCSCVPLGMKPPLHSKVRTSFAAGVLRVATAVTVGVWLPEPVAAADPQAAGRKRSQQPISMERGEAFRQKNRFMRIFLHFLKIVS